MPETLYENIMHTKSISKDGNNFLIKYLGIFINTIASLFVATALGKMVSNTALILVNMPHCQNRPSMYAPRKPLLLYKNHL